MPLLSLQSPPAWLHQARQAPARQPNLNSRRPTFALYTLGCKVNQADSHHIARLLLAAGLERVEFGHSADAYVIDTCTVTHQSDRKSRQVAARAARLNPRAVVAITGCAATYSPEQFRRAVPNALILSNAQKLELPERVLEKLRQIEAEERDWDDKYLQMRAAMPIEPQFGATRERAVIKIQDGCSHACSYCIIPTVRGASVSKSHASIVREAGRCVQEGAREIVLTGVSMGEWSSRHSDGGARIKADEARPSRNRAMCDLLRAVAVVDGLSRVRTSSLDPADVDEEWLRCVAETPGVCPQIHLALQSGSAGVLRRMRRRYTPERFLKWARLWRQLRPDGGLTTDVIVGFPGESEAEWQETLAVVREAAFSHIHAFPFSPRRDTVAASLPGAIAPQVQKRRMEELESLSQQLAARFAAQFVGQEVEILVEGSRRDGWIEGLTPGYLKCRGEVAAGGREWRAGELARVQVLGWSGGALTGRVAD